jgi:hypothetical protein
VAKREFVNTCAATVAGIRKWRLWRKEENVANRLEGRREGVICEENKRGGEEGEEGLSGGVKADGVGRGRK